MPNVFCDNEGCIYADEYGFCGLSDLRIDGGVCVGSAYSGNGRNATGNDIDEQLRAENAKLRNACYGLFYATRAVEVAKGEALIGPNLANLLRELGIEVRHV